MIFPQQDPKFLFEWNFGRISQRHNPFDRERNLSKNYNKKGESAARTLEATFFFELNTFLC